MANTFVSADVDIDSTQASAVAALAAGATPTQIANICAQPTLKQVACPAFIAGAASLAMGTAKASECVITSARTLAADSTLTLAATDAAQGLYYVTVRALSLGYVLTIANGGAGGGNLTTVPTSMTVPRTLCFFFDGTNFYYDGMVWVNP